MVAPSITPTRSGDRIKTDKRDARKLARLLRSGELTAVYIPEPTDEAIGDLCRARTDAVDDRRRARHRLKAFLLRHGYRYHGRTAWSEAHMRYLRELVLPHPAMKVILEDYLVAIDAAHERIARCEAAMHDLLPGWRLEPAVQALMAMKGFQIVAAMILVSELGEIHRFNHPRQVMAYLGLVPTENTSSEKRRQGGITKCGNGHARWLLIESAQHYHHATESLPAAQQTAKRSVARGARDQLENAKPFAQPFHAPDRAPAATQQSAGSDCPGTVRLCLGTLAHAAVLSTSTFMLLKGKECGRKRPRNQLSIGEPRFPKPPPLMGTAGSSIYLHRLN